MHTPDSPAVPVAVFDDLPDAAAAAAAAESSPLPLPEAAAAAAAALFLPAAEAAAAAAAESPDEAAAAAAAALLPAAAAAAAAPLDPAEEAAAAAAAAFLEAAAAAAAAADEPEVPAVAASFQSRHQSQFNRHNYTSSTRMLKRKMCSHCSLQSMLITLGKCDNRALLTKDDVCITHIHATVSAMFHMQSAHNWQRELTSSRGGSSSGR